MPGIVDLSGEVRLPWQTLIGEIVSRLPVTYYLWRLQALFPSIKLTAYGILKASKLDLGTDYETTTIFQGVRFADGARLGCDAGLGRKQGNHRTPDPGAATATADDVDAAQL